MKVSVHISVEVMQNLAFTAFNTLHVIPVRYLVLKEFFSDLQSYLRSLLVEED